MFNEIHDLMQLTATTKSVFQMGKLLQFTIIKDPLSNEMEAIFKLLSKLEKKLEFSCKYEERNTNFRRTCKASFHWLNNFVYTVESSFVDRK